LAKKQGLPKKEALPLVAKTKLLQLGKKETRRKMTKKQRRQMVSLVQELVQVPVCMASKQSKSTILLPGPFLRCYPPSVCVRVCVFVCVYAYNRWVAKQCSWHSLDS